MILSSLGISRWMIRVCVVGVAAAGLTGCAEMAGDSTRSRNEAAQLYAAGSYSDAVGAYKNAVRTDPRDYKAHYGLAASYDGMRSYQLAVAQYKTTLDVMTRTLLGRDDAPFRAKVIDSLGACVARSDHRDAEIAALVAQAASQKPEDSFILAKAYAHSGDADNALEAYNRAYMLDKNNFYINKERGLFLVKIGQRQQAAEPLRRAYAANPQDEEVNAALRQIDIVPGLSLKDEKDLAQPLVPKGPLPEAKMPRFSSRDDSPASDAAPSGTGAVQVPRD